MTDNTTPAPAPVEERHGGVSMALMLAAWVAAASLAAIAVMSVLGHLSRSDADEAHLAALTETRNAIQRLDQNLIISLTPMSALVDGVDDFGIAVREQTSEIAEHNDTVERDQGLITDYLFNLQGDIESQQAWECVHAWYEVFDLEGFDFDAIRGSATGEEVLDLLSDLYIGCSLEFGPLGGF